MKTPQIPALPSMTPLGIRPQPDDAAAIAQRVHLRAFGYYVRQWAAVPNKPRTSTAPYRGTDGGRTRENDEGY